MFTLNKFRVKHKDNYIYDCEFNNLKRNERELIFTTLIIGENGVGKSYLLSVLSDFFKFIDRSNKTFKYEEAEVQYDLQGYTFEINKKNDQVSFFRDGKEIDVSQLSTPKKILALSFMVNDKFSFSKDQDNSYCYLGVRATSNATYTSSIQKKLLSSLLMSLSDSKRAGALCSAFDFLDITNKIKIKYKLKRKTLFSRPMLEHDITRKLDSLSKRSNFYSSEASLRIYEAAYGLVEFIDNIKNLYVKKESSIVLTIDLAGKNFDGVKKINYFEMLEMLGFVGAPEVNFVKNDEFNFEYTSSGEKHIVYTMVNLIAHIEDDCLLLIDEPELSLHPRWQMRYLKLLKDVTRGFYSAHCILASHSHFMVSDLDPTSSSLVILNIADAARISKLIEYDTHAWSAENILYSVFGLRSTRNFYFEKDVSDLLELISSQSKNLERITYLHEKLRKYVLDENDPLNTVLLHCGIYLKSVNND